MHSANRAKQRLRYSAAAAGSAVVDAKTNLNKKTDLNRNRSSKLNANVNYNSPYGARRSKSLERKAVSNRRNIVKETQSPKPIKSLGKTVHTIYFISLLFFIWASGGISII